jgi:WD40 repeat protein
MLKLTGRRNTVEMLVFSPDSRWVVGGGDGGIHVWDSLTGKLHAHFSGHVRYRFAKAITFISPTRFFVPTPAGWSICDINAKAIATRKQPLDGWLTMSDDGKFLACSWYQQALSVLDVGSEKATLRWTAEAKRGIPNSELPTFIHDSDCVLSLEQPYGRFFTEKQYLAVRRTLTGELVSHLSCPEVVFAQFELSADGKHIFGQTVRSVYIWNLDEPNAKPRKLTNPSARHVAGIAAYPGGGQVATIDNDRNVRLWDTTTLELLHTLEWDIGKLHAIAFSPDGMRCAVGSGRGTVLIWDVE